MDAKTFGKHFERLRNEEELSKEQRDFETKKLLDALLIIDNYCDKCTYCELNVNNKRGEGCGYESRKQAIKNLKESLNL